MQIIFYVKLGNMHVQLGKKSSNCQFFLRVFPTVRELERKNCSWRRIKHEGSGHESRGLTLICNSEPPLRTRGEWFWEEEKNVTLSMLCQLGSQFQNFTFKCCILTCCSTLENDDCVTLTSTEKCFLKRFWNLRQWGNVFLDFFKAKNEEKLQNLFFYCLDQKPFCPCWEEKKY